jgi:hypothetical protein
MGALIATTLASATGLAEVTAPVLARLLPYEPTPFRFPIAERKMELLQLNPVLLGKGCMAILASRNPEVVIPGRVYRDPDLGTFAIRLSQRVLQSFGLPGFVGVVPVPVRYLASKTPEQVTVQITPTAFGNPTGIAAYGTF